LQLDKNTILDFLREQGQQDQASQAEQELPDQVDTDQHANLLEKFGINPQDLIQKFMGGGGLPKF
jgi:DNA-binding protein H-NS